MNETPNATIGHNRPPIREVLAERTNDVADYLEVEGEDLIGRANELLAKAKDLPAVIEDQDTAGRFTDLISEMTKALKAAEVRRVADKEPVLSAGRVIDGFYGKIKETIDKAKSNINQRLTAWDRKKADEERKRREEEERRRRAEEERLKKETEDRLKAAKDEADIQAAIEAEAAARQAQADRVKAEQEAKEKAAKLHKDRGQSGAVSSLRTNWDFENLDRATLDLEALRQHLSQDALEKAVRIFIRVGGRELKGVRIFENTSSVVR